MNRADQEYCIGRGIAAIRGGTAYDTEFLHASLLASLDRLLMLTTGSTFPNLSRRDLESFEIPWPEETQRRKIAHIVKSLTDKIENNNRLAKTMEELAASLFTSTFVDFVGRDDLTESKIGLIPRGWSVSSVGDLGGIHKESTKGVSDLPYIGLDDMPRGSTVLAEWKTVDAPTGQAMRFARGDILFGKLRPYFRKVGVAPIDGRCSTEILVLRPDDPSYHGFLLGHVSSQQFIDHCIAVSRGTRMPRAEWRDAGAYPVAVPPRDVAADFTAFMETVYALIRVLVQQSRTLAAVRNLLLPRLTSGQIRVPYDAELAAEPA